MISLLGDMRKEHQSTCNSTTRHWIDNYHSTEISVGKKGDYTHAWQPQKENSFICSSSAPNELIKKVNSQMEKYVPCSVFVEYMQGVQKTNQQMALIATRISDTSIALDETMGEEDTQILIDKMRDNIVEDCGIYFRINGRKGQSKVLRDVDDCIYCATRDLYKKNETLGVFTMVWWEVGLLERIYFTIMGRLGWKLVSATEWLTALSRLKRLGYCRVSFASSCNLFYFDVCVAMFVVFVNGLQFIFQMFLSRCIFSLWNAQVILIIWTPLFYSTWYSIHNTEPLLNTPYEKNVFLFSLHFPCCFIAIY